MNTDFEKKVTLCWYCENAIGRCAWSSRLRPVEGWTAEKTRIKATPDAFIDSYRVIECPCFEKDHERPKPAYRENRYA